VQNPGKFGGPWDQMYVQNPGDFIGWTEVYGEIRGNSEAIASQLVATSQKVRVEQRNMVH
jgi:hypothetical protein